MLTDLRPAERSSRPAAAGEPGARGSRRWAGLAAALALGALLGALGLGNHELWTPDEPREAGIAREMWRSGAFWVPRLGGEAFLEKPPLHAWLQSAVFSAFGASSAGLARLPSALFSFGTLLWIAAFAVRSFGAPAAACCVLTLLTTWSFALRSHWGILDTALLFGITGALICGRLAGEAETPARRRAAWLGATALLALAFFSKGPIGVGLPLLSLATLALLERRPRELVPLAAAGAAVGALGALWVWGVWFEEGAAGVRAFLLENQLGRLLPGALHYAGGHERPLHYYLLQGPVELLPWTPLAILAALGARRNWARLAAPARAGLRLVGAAVLPPLALLSLAGTKRGLYLLPLMPWLALLVAWWLTTQAPAAGSRQARFAHGWRRFLVGCACLLPAASALAGGAAWAWLLASAALGAAALLAERQVDVPWERRWSHAQWLLGAAWGCLLIGGPPLLDRAKSLRPAAEAIDRAVPPGAALCALEPTETLRGVLAFYTERRLCSLPDVAALEATVAAGNTWLVLEAERRSDPTAAELARRGLPLRLQGEYGPPERRFSLLQPLGADSPSAELPPVVAQ